LVQLARVHEQLRAAGVIILTISPQSVDENLALKLRRELPFELLADEDLELIHEWKVFDTIDSEARRIPFPTTAIISQDRELLWQYVGKHKRDRPTADEIVDLLKSKGLLHDSPQSS